MGEAKICAPQERMSYQQLETQKFTEMIPKGTGHFHQLFSNDRFKLRVLKYGALGNRLSRHGLATALILIMSYFLFGIIKKHSFSFLFKHILKILKSIFVHNCVKKSVFNSIFVSLTAKQVNQLLVVLPLTLQQMSSIKEPTLFKEMASN